MTFEDFLHESPVGYSTIETKDDLEYVIKTTWNAAIKEAIRQATLPCRSGAAGQDRLPSDLYKLLTSK